ncbi:MAG TPA: type II secretion system F family protein [Verrucomicrobiae bacterium]|jgi:type II secretory pathway component PulF|nr:type II secretion system F family protein [Verrucomicrobiae bacterium]
MPQFRFLAKVNPTQTVEDVLEMESREAVLQYLSKMGYTPLKVIQIQSAAPAAGKISGRAVSFHHLQSFTRQFASLIRSQTPVLRALRVLEEQAESPRLKAILNAVLDNMERNGATLSEALRCFPETFPADYVNLINAGELGGAIEEILDKLAEKMDREAALRSKLQSAVVYPAFVGVMGAVTVVVLLVFVMPRILVMLKRLHVELPWPTRALIALTHILTHPFFWAGAAALAILGIIVWKGLSSQAGELFDKLLLRVPVAGRVALYTEMVRFCRSLGLLMDHGVLIIQALEASIAVVGNRWIRSQLETLPKMVREGHLLTEGMKKLPLASPYLLQTLKVGEEGGRMPEGLLEAANFLEREAVSRMQVLASLLEPVMILAVGAVVGFIVMATMLPIFEISSSIR